MLWVLKRTVSMRHMLKIIGKKILQFYVDNFVSLNLCLTQHFRSQLKNFSAKRYVVGTQKHVEENDRYM